MALKSNASGVDYQGSDILEQAMSRKPRLASGGAPGAVVYTERLLDFQSAVVPLFNPTYGIAMNVDGSFGGTPLGIHNGGDNAYWTGSNVVGTKVDFASATRPFQGAFGIHVDSPSLDDTWQFLSPSVVSAGSYLALTARVNVNRRWDGNDEIQVYLWDSVGASVVGVRVDMSVYINEQDFDVWQTMVIPLSDLGAANLPFDAVRMTLSDNTGSTPDLFLDNIQLEESGEPIGFTAAAPGNKPFYVHKIRITIANNIPSTVTGGTMPGIDYDSLMGLTLTNGLAIQRVLDGEVSFAAGIRTVSDFVQAGGEITNPISNGVNTMFCLDSVQPDPLILYPDPEQNFLKLLVNDDLSGLSLMNAFALGSVVTESNSR